MIGWQMKNQYLMKYGESNVQCNNKIGKLAQVETLKDALLIKEAVKPK